jgi:adenylate cyclase
MTTGTDPATARDGGRRAGDRAQPMAERVLRRVAAAHVVAGAIGTADVFLLLWFVLPPPEHSRADDPTILLVNAIAVAILLPLGMITGTAWGYRIARPMRRFDAEGRVPTEDERLATVRQPIRGAGIDAILWLVGALVLAGINTQFSADMAFHVGSTIAMGGATTTAVTYLLSERLLRPMTARALAAGPVPQPCGLGVQRRLLLVWMLATGVPLLGLFFVGVHVLEEGGSSPERLALSVLILAFGAAATGLAATVLVARSLAEPLDGLRTALGRIEEGDLDAEVQVDDASEVGLLQSGFNRMVAGLRERERLRDLFGRHVGEEVAENALDQPAALGGERRSVAVLFVDLVGSTALADRSDPEEVVALLNRFFAIVVETVDARGGFVNKFEGDAALCVFGAPVEHDDCAAAALDSARALHERLERELPEVDAGIGVSAGEAVAGNVGAEHRFEYTVIGDPVNEAARLCELAKRRPQRVVACEAVLKAANGDEPRRWRLDEEVVLRGRTEPTRLAVSLDGDDAVTEREPAGSGRAAS